MSKNNIELEDRDYKPVPLEEGDDWVSSPPTVRRPPIRQSKGGILAYFNRRTVWIIVGGVAAIGLFFFIWMMVKTRDTCTDAQTSEVEVDEKYTFLYPDPDTIYGHNYPERMGLFYTITSWRDRTCGSWPWRKSFPEAPSSVLMYSIIERKNGTSSWNTTSPQTLAFESERKIYLRDVLQWDNQPLLFTQKRDPISKQTVWELISLSNWNTYDPQNNSAPLVQKTLASFSNPTSAYYAIVGDDKRTIYVIEEPFDPYSTEIDTVTIYRVQNGGANQTNQTIVSQGKSLFVQAYGNYLNSTTLKANLTIQLGTIINNAYVYFLYQLDSNSGNWTLVDAPWSKNTLEVMYFSTEPQNATIVTLLQEGSTLLNTTDACFRWIGGKLESIEAERCDRAPRADGPNSVTENFGGNIYSFTYPGSNNQSPFPVSCEDYTKALQKSDKEYSDVKPQVVSVLPLDSTDKCASSDAFCVWIYHSAIPYWSDWITFTSGTSVNSTILCPYSVTSVTPITNATVSSMTTATTATTTTTTSPN